MITVTLPIRTRNALNVREHWAVRSKRSKSERSAACTVLRTGPVPSDYPLAVYLTRIAPRRMDEGCGLNASLKAVRDGVADFLGVDDGDARVLWIYGQRKGEPKQYAVEIVIRTATDEREFPMMKARITGWEAA